MSASALFQPVIGAKTLWGKLCTLLKGTVLTEGTAGMVESACAAVQRFTPKCSEKNCRSVTVLFVCFSFVVLSSALAGQNS